MTRDEFCEAGIRLHGRRWGWQTSLAGKLHVDISTIQRWVSGAVPIPGPTEVAILALLKLDENKIKPLK